MHAYHQAQRLDHGNRKYNEQHAREWRRMLREEKLSLLALSRKVGVKRETIQKCFDDFNV